METLVVVVLCIVGVSQLVALGVNLYHMFITIPRNKSTTEMWVAKMKEPSVTLSTAWKKVGEEDELALAVKEQ